MALSPQAKYTDWSTATCRQNLVPTFADRGMSRGQRGGSPTAVNLSFLDRTFRSKHFYLWSIFILRYEQKYKKFTYEVISEIVWSKWKIKWSNNSS
jgi:hypothetical protein